MKSAIQLLKQCRSHPKTVKGSMVQRAVFKDSIDFAGSNKVVREMYERIKGE